MNYSQCKRIKFENWFIYQTVLGHLVISGYIKPRRLKEELHVRKQGYLQMDLLNEREIIVMELFPSLI